jgi:hypothetical protein
MSYVVVAPLVITKKPDGSDLYLYENAVLPEDVTDAEVKRLAARGFISKVTAAVAAEADAPISESN